MCARHMFDEDDMPCCERTDEHEPSAANCRYYGADHTKPSEPGGHK